MNMKETLFAAFLAAWDAEAWSQTTPKQVANWVAREAARLGQIRHDNIGFVAAWLVTEDAAREAARLAEDAAREQAVEIED